MEKICQPSPQENLFLEPLSLTTINACAENDQSESEVALHENISESSQLICVLCEKNFFIENDFLKHVEIDHQLRIEAFGEIPYKNEYIKYWKEKFQKEGVKQLCPSILSEGDNFVYVLNETNRDDVQIRSSLKQKKLAEVVEVLQQQIQSTGFSRMCLFCSEHFIGDKKKLFEHLVDVHNFYLGPYENIVFSDELLDVIEEKLKNLQCLYCEKTYKSYIVLKEHMRKKRHKRFRASNQFYHKFFLEKYKEFEWYKSDSDDGIHDDDDDDGEEILSQNYKRTPMLACKETITGDWHEKEMDKFCLFCNFSSNVHEEILSHLKVKHLFDMESLCNKLSYFQVIKLINYIRRQAHQLTCFACLDTFGSLSELREHFSCSDHSSVIPELHHFDQPQYFFPTFENDNFLSDVVPRNDETLNDHVIPEDNIFCKVLENLKSDQIINEKTFDLIMKRLFEFI